MSDEVSVPYQPDEFGEKYRQRPRVIRGQADKAVAHGVDPRSFGRYGYLIIIMHSTHDRRIPVFRIRYTNTGVLPSVCV
jgi:hypothetical protein